jgi:hypothetical protein
MVAALTEAFKSADLVQTPLKSLGSTAPSKKAPARG